MIRVQLKSASAPSWLFCDQNVLSPPLAAGVAFDGLSSQTLLPSSLPQAQNSNFNLNPPDNSHLVLKFIVIRFYWIHCKSGFGLTSGVVLVILAAMPLSPLGCKSSTSILTSSRCASLRSPALAAASLACPTLSPSYISIIESRPPPWAWIRVFQQFPTSPIWC
jgi:hypothetical protein